MNMIPKTSEEYFALVEQVVALVDVELIAAESFVESGELHSLINKLPGLISIVNVVGYFRGQDGFFLGVRPSVGDKQKELYGFEDAAEKRLGDLIEHVCKTTENRERYLEHMRMYYLYTRTPEAWRKVSGTPFG
jgi:hypothetical protein